MDKKMNKRGQLTIFIILGIILAVGIILIFFIKPEIIFPQSSTSNPEGFIEKCVSDSFKNSEKITLENNGFSNNNYSNFMVYKSEKVPYLCVSSEFYTACTPQEPGFLLAITNRIENKIARDAADCVYQLKEDFESKGYSVQSDEINLTLSFYPDFASIELKLNFLAEKAEQKILITDYNFRQPSSIYDLIKTAQTIVNYESALCEFNDLNWMKSINKIMIIRQKVSDQTKVYTLTDRNTQDEIKFAVKTCVLPAGI